jgi:hexosaminidase
MFHLKDLDADGTEPVTSRQIVFLHHSLLLYRYCMRLRHIATLLAIALPAASQTPLHLIPMPRQITQLADQTIASATVVCNACENDDLFAAQDLRQTLADRGLPTGSALKIVLQRLAAHPDATFTAAMQPEGYTIDATTGTLTLTGATPAGVFYAAQTAKQLIVETNGTFTLHAANIHDWPAMQYRGLSDDLSRGPIDTLDFQKKLIRTLAAYKDNLYSPYFESAQQYASNPLIGAPGGSISAADARELVAYAAQYHVLIVPDQEAFGHLRHTLIWEQYQPLAETPHGAVLAPAQPGSLQLISQEFTELAQLYPGPFLHIGADETDDLGLGQTKAAVDAQGLGPVYLDFMQQIDNTLRPLHRRLLFWGDIAYKSPDLLKAMPAQFKQDTIAIAWEYNPRARGFAKFLKPYTDAGFETWVSPGINNWSRIYPNNNYALANIQQFTRDGQAIGATGQLNTDWYDDGEALASNNWYGILFGAAAAWQKGESSIPQFEQSYAQVFHNDATGKLNQAQLELMAAHDLLKTQAKTGDGSDGLFWLDPFSTDGQDYATRIRPFTHDLRMHAEAALTLIAQARSANPSLRETEAIDALELGARRFDFIGLKFQLADEIASGYALALTNSVSADKKTKALVDAELSDINGVNGRLQDIKDGYALLRDQYESLWLKTNRTYALRPVLEHYDYTIGIWYARIDKVKSAQRAWANQKPLPTAADLGIPGMSGLAAGVGH